MDFGLKGKRAFVAGGGRGIGKAIAIELAKEGVDLVIASRSIDQLEQTANEINSISDVKVFPLSVDVTVTEQVNNAFERTEELLGGLDILVNSASLPGGSPSAVGYIEGVDEQELMNDFDVKFVGALRCSRAAIPLLKKQDWGRIINISGANARNAGNLSGGARNVSLVHMTKTLSTQLGRYGITVNCIHPGTTRTERTEDLYSARGEEHGLTASEMELKEFEFGSRSGNAICRMVDAAEIAYLTVFLASNKSWSVTGEVITATGGSGNAVYY
tara:strand:+ start:952 stop:1770 length:819 start_codon:yes stop_codon:yes gene_type:complete